MDDIKCCYECYKKEYCTGCDWYSKLCNRDRKSCTYRKLNCKVCDKDDKCKSE